MKDTLSDWNTWEEFIWAVRRNRAELVEKYGGIDGLHKHMDEERPRLEKEGWKFVDEVRKERRQEAAQ
jgi:hypothetical protein